MNVPLFIAHRYLFARKSHNVINIISAISAIGMAIGTAALVLILSVYNGFDSLVEQSVSDLSPDLMLVSSDGLAKFQPDSLLTDALARDERVLSVRYILEDNVLLTYGDGQCIARARGVDDGYELTSKVGDHIVEGTFTLQKGDIPCAVLGSTIAYKMGIHPRFTDPIRLYYPDRDGNFSPSNPAASANSEKLFASGIMSISSDTDASLILIPLHTMRSLLHSPGEEVSGVEIKLKDSSPRAVKLFRKDYGQRCTLLDRYQQQPTLFKMMRYEKAAVFLIMLFVVIIVALNIYGSLSMLIIEKENDIETLRALGAGDGMIRRVFVLEGWLISLLGLAVGLVTGIALALMQQHLGLVKMPGNFLIDSYPVVLKAGDIALITIAVAAIGLLISLIAAGRRSQPR